MKPRSADNVLNYRTAPVYARETHDWYVESASAVEKLLDVVKFDGPVHDPSCGGGNIPRVAISRGYSATGSDLVDRGYGEGGIDFLDDPTPRVNILANPPYVIAERFVLHGLKIAERRVAVLVRLAFLEGQGRRKRLFLPHPPERVLVFATRPSMPPGGMAIEAKGGKTAFAWICWNNARDSLFTDTTMTWLP